MNRQQRRYTEAMARKRGRNKKFEACLSDITNMADAVFVGNHERHGWVLMCASPIGRGHIEALFPNVGIAWRDTGAEEDLPNDWLGFDVNVPDAVAAIATKLPLDIIKGADLNEVDPNALAYLLACGVNRQGGRSAVWMGEEMTIFVPTTSNN